MKIVLASFLFMISGMVRAQTTLYTSRNVTFSFFSSAPIEDIKAKATDGVSALDIKTKSVYFKVKMRSFVFEKDLMQQHFNEDYLESSKYPYAEFKGKIKEDIDLSHDGAYPVTVQGTLNIHNVTKNYTVKAVINVRNSKITANSSFSVKLADHNIKIPRLVIKNIAEVVQVSISAPYEQISK